MSKIESSELRSTNIKEQSSGLNLIDLFKSDNRTNLGTSVSSELILKGSPLAFVDMPMQPMQPEKGKVADMSKVAPEKIDKGDIKQQADWLLWKASTTKPDTRGRILVEVPSNFAPNIIDKIATDSGLAEKFKDAHYQNIRKTSGATGEKYLSVIRTK